MTVDLVLVSKRAPTMAELRTAVARADRNAGLGTATLVGDWADDDPMVEMSAPISANELLMQLFRPEVSLTTSADRYTVQLGLARPADDDGHCWLTHMAMSARADDEQVTAALAVVRQLARAADGFVVINGEYAPLDGVPEPERLTEDAAPDLPAPPPARAFVQLFLTTKLDGEPGWRTSMDLLRWLLDGHWTDPDLRPHYIEREGEWRPFRPGDPAPEWWPLPQRFLTPQPWVAWRLNPAFGPADRLTQLELDGDLDAAVTQSFVPQLVQLATKHLVYGFVHAWHLDEAVAPKGLRNADDRPQMLLSPRTLGEYLPNLYWAQLFGPPWVELFGRERLASTPGYRVDEVAPEHWLVQLTEHLADVSADGAARAEYVRVRDAAKRHLGLDAFFSRDRGPRGSYRTAQLPTLLERGLVPPPPQLG